MTDFSSLMIEFAGLTQAILFSLKIPCTDNVINKTTGQTNQAQHCEIGIQTTEIKTTKTIPMRVRESER